MSTSENKGSTSSKTQENDDDLEPGACPESILNPADTFEEFASEISSSLQDRNVTCTKSSTISEIQSEIAETSAETKIRPTKSSDDLQSKEVRFHF